MVFQSRLEIRHLRMLQAMAITGNITHAATILQLTQSALSHQIREAERRLGVRLFVREAKRMQMTPAARSLNDEGARILARLERVERSVTHGSAAARPAVRIGCGAYSCYRWLPRFLNGFQIGSPDVDIEVVADATQQPVKALLDRKIDLAVTSSAPAKSTMRSLRLFRDELILITARDHPLAGKNVISAHDLADQVYISYSDVAEKGHEFDSFLKPARVSYRRLMKVETHRGHHRTRDRRLRCQHPVPLGGQPLSQDRGARLCARHLARFVRGTGTPRCVNPSPRSPLPCAWPRHCSSGARTTIRPLLTRPWVWPGHAND